MTYEVPRCPTCRKVNERTISPVNRMAIVSREIVLTLWDGATIVWADRGNGWQWWAPSRMTREAIERLHGLGDGYLDAIEDMQRMIERAREEHDAAHRHAETVRIQEAARLEQDTEQRLRFIENELQRQFALGRHPELRRWRDANPTPHDQIPECLREVRAAKRLEVASPCYVYFLLREGTVVYVGQTSSPWPGRILDHVRLGEKQFDDVWYTECDRPSLNHVEAHYIRLFRPEYNVAGTRRREPISVDA